MTLILQIDIFYQLSSKGKSQYIYNSIYTTLNILCDVTFVIGLEFSIVELVKKKYKENVCMSLNKMFCFS